MILDLEVGFQNTKSLVLACGICKTQMQPGRRNSYPAAAGGVLDS